MTFYLFIIGLVSILGQVVVLRELSVAFYGVELIYILAMGVWLLWTATGALIGRRGYAPRPAVVGWLFAAFALTLAADVVFIRHIRVIFGGIPGAFLPFGVQIAAMLVVLLPIGVLLGLLFQWAAKLYVADSRTLATAYAIESAGGLVGGLASTVLLALGVQNLKSALLCGFLALSTLLFPRRLPRPHRVPAVVVLALFALAWMQADQIDFQSERVNHPDLVDSRDSPYGRIAVVQRGEQTIVFDNDVIAFESQSPAAEELVHLPLLNLKRAHRVLLLGGGIEGLVLEVLKLAPDRVDYVELNPVLLDMSNEYMPDRVRATLHDPAVEVHRADPRAFLRGAAGYDAVLVAMPNPTSGQTNRFYTREFFADCSHALTPNGVLAFRLVSSENVWTRAMAYRNTSIYRALRSSFEDVVVLPGAANIVIAANRTLERDAAVLAEWLASRRLNTRLVTREYVEYLYTNDRFFSIAERLEETSVPANTDAYPIAYRYSTTVWVSKFIPGLFNWDPLTGAGHHELGVYAAIFSALALTLTLALRRSAGGRRVALVAVAGFAGMVLETVVMLHYQATSGVLFQNLGILLMAFMAGLGFGALDVPRVIRRVRARGHATRFVGIGLVTGVAILAFGT
ncbi:MAG: hypothetical protein PVF33_03690, partial [Candidatus Latescibacterota bacterium]